MASSGQAKAEYQREYMSRRRRAEASPPSCRPGTSERLLVGDRDNCVICEGCIALATARIAEARRRWLVAGGASVPRSRRWYILPARRFSPAGFSFALARRGDLLALPFQPPLSRCDWYHQPGKSRGPSPFAASLQVQGDTHN
jgi:hypothetical protein